MLADALERFGKTVAQVLATRLTAVGMAMLTYTNFGYALFVALIAGAMSLLISGLRNLTGFWVKDANFMSGAASRSVITLVAIVVALLITHELFEGFVFTWSGTIGQAVFAGGLSILTSLASYPVGRQGSPSLVGGAN
jgi:hypothetical protein